MNDIFQKLDSILICTKCFSNQLALSEDLITCDQCQHTYKVRDNEKIIATDEYIQDDKWEHVSEGFNLFKGNEKPIKLDKLGGPRIKDLIQSLDINGIAINLGSGQDNYDGFLNIDLGDYEPVDIVANLKTVPLSDESVELIVSNSVLEHIYDYEKVVDEAYRILKKGGYFYLCVPSVCLRHHKVDYHRWTTPGLHKLFEGRYTIMESGACRGAAYALFVFVEALIAYKIKNKYFLSFVRFVWKIISKPLFWMEDESNEEYQALSQTIYVLGKKI
jgi:SAM-dependent methyltransferase